MNQLFSIFIYGLVAMVISFTKSLQAAPNKTDPRCKVSTAKDWQGFISKSKGIKVQPRLVNEDAYQSSVE